VKHAPENDRHPPAAMKKLAWRAEDGQRMEVAHIEAVEPHLTASGTQLGATYELRYWLTAGSLVLELVGERKLGLSLDGADFFDLAWSPLFNSLPVLRDRLLERGARAREYQMRWIDVPSLEVRSSQQCYEPLGNGVVRFSAGSFSSDIRFDQSGFVLDYPGLATRLRQRDAD
jgi:uncharacterized protein